MIRGKFLFNNPKQINSGFKEGNLLSLTLNGVLRKDMNSGEGLRPETYETYQVFEKENLVFKFITLSFALLLDILIFLPKERRSIAVSSSLPEAARERSALREPIFVFTTKLIL